jgi:uncharacterized integral membrane protein
MVRLIISLVILVVLAVLLVFNGTFMTPVNLFGYQIERVPVVVVAIVGFVFGVLYSFVLYLMRFLAKRHSTTIKSKDRDVRMREQEIKEKEKQLDTLAGDLAESVGGTTAGPADQDLGVPEPPAAGRRLRRIARKKK